MGKEIKVAIINKTTLKLLENAEAGDFIDLSSALTVDVGYINDLINEEKDKAISQKIENKVREALANAKLEFKNESLKKENELKETYEKSIRKLEKDNDSLKNQIDNINKSFEEKIKIKELEIEREIKEEFDKKLENSKEIYEKNNKELADKLEAKEKAYEILSSNYKKDLEIETYKTKNELEKGFEKERTTLKQTIDQLERNKSLLNVKQIGEDLEKWCDTEVVNAMQNGFLNCTWYKDTLIVKNEDENKGSKADFIFKVYASEEKKDDELLTSVCLDMKGESLDSVNKKSNKDYYAQLDKNRIKKNCKYAILVSELEMNKINDIPIFKVNEYKDMYVIRPSYLLTFLNMLVSLNVSFARLTLEKEKERLMFKSQEEFENSFEDLKNTYLDKPLGALKKEIDDLSSQNNSIKKASENIEGLIGKIKKSYIENIEEKLNKFSINTEKAYRKLEKANQ